MNICSFKGQECWENLMSAKPDIENPVIHMNTVFKDCSLLEK